MTGGWFANNPTRYVETHRQLFKHAVRRTGIAYARICTYDGSGDLKLPGFMATALLSRPGSRLADQLSRFAEY